MANDVRQAGGGFGSETNQVVLLDPDGGVEALPLLPKRQVARRILDRVVALRHQHPRGEDAGTATAAPRSPGL